MAAQLVFTQSLLSELRAQLLALAPSSVLLLCDTNTRQHAAPLAAAIDATLLEVPAGEEHKNMDTATALWQKLLAAGADRQAVLVNVGGGMITDLGGFVAGNYKRGIRCVLVPSSLLAQVDAAIGGKTGINVQGFKNAVGLFYEPEAVLFDTALLRTLPERELISGKAEMFKHGILADEGLFTALTQLAPAEIPALELLQRAVQIKSNIVAIDPTEQAERKLLNFGHTLGHALESYFMHSQQPLLHGEAVFMGMLGETRLAVAMGILSETAGANISKALLPYQPERHWPHIEALMPWLLHDKKNRGAKISFSLPTAIGEAIFDQQLLPDELRALVSKIYNHP
jgi:3-dehydroquinate synthase